MNKITIILKESGTIAELKKNFNIYQNSSQNVLLNILVPKPMVEGKFSAQFTNEDGQVVENGVYTAVKIGMVYIDNSGKYGKSETYFVRYLKEIKASECEFYVYERIMPSVFTRVAGVGTFAPKMVINVMNILNSQTESADGTISENPTVLTLITTQECSVDIEPSTNLDVEPEVDATELELLEGQMNELTAEMDKKVDGDYLVQKYNLEETIPENIHYEKDGFKTKGVRFYNETFTVPISNTETASKDGEIYVSNVRPHEAELYWILQDEVFHYDTGMAVRTLVINAVQASINQYTTMSVGEWQLVNQEYLDSIKSQSDQNSEDIETLYRYYNTGTNYLGEYPSQSTLPTDDELNQYVQTNFNRAPQNGDELTFVLLVEDGTDVVYMIKYSEVKATWIETPLPSVEPAKNGTMGIIQGTGEEDITSTRKVLIDIENGEIEDIIHANESEEKESISDHLNRNSQNITHNASDIEAETERAESAEETITNNLNAEISRATTAESGITDALNSEITRATSAEETLETSIETETERATSAENSIAEDLEEEITRAQQAEQTNANAISAETTRATNAEGALDTDKLDKDNVNANYLKNIVFSVNGDSGVATLTLNNPVTGQTQNIEITVTSPASSTNTGLMTSEMVQALNNAIEDIESLKYIGKQIASFQTYAEAELFDFSTISSINENDYFIVYEDESRTEPSEKDKTTRYVCIDNTAPITIDSFQFFGVVDTVLIQVATETSLGGVLSTNTNGYIYVENTGAMKLVGYDNIISSINNLTTAITNEATRAENAEEALSQAITTETTRAQQAEQQNSTAISTEAARAQQAEQANASAISAETQRAQQAEQENASAIETKVDKTTTVAGKPLSANVSLGTLTIKQNSSDIGDYNGETDEEIDIITPTTTSDLTNDGDGTLVNGISDPYAKVSQIPTNNNQLTNGAGYATQSELNSEISARQTADNNLQSSINNKTTVNINGTVQTSISFDSDPQIQINSKSSVKTQTFTTMSALRTFLTNNSEKVINVKFDNNTTFADMPVYDLVISENGITYSQVGGNSLSGNDIYQLNNSGILFTNDGTTIQYIDVLNRKYYTGGRFVNVQSNSVTLRTGITIDLPDDVGTWTVTYYE